MTKTICLFPVTSPNRFWIWPHLNLNFIIKYNVFVSAGCSTNHSQFMGSNNAR